MRVSAPAKINLHLRVGPPTPDGFHPLLSWMVTVALFDTLDFSPANEPGVRLRCDDPAIPTDASNLIVKAASALQSQLLAARSSPHAPAVSGLSAALQKRIPVGAGLGGGSSDGAATIAALNQLWKLRWNTQQLSDFSAGLGSDLPFFFHGPSSICTGRGQFVRPTPPPKPRHALLILPNIHMATPLVYKRFDEMALGRTEAIADSVDWPAWTALDADDLLPRLINDLESPAFSLSAPLNDLHRRASQTLGRIVRMSGSGSSLFTLYDDPAEADDAAQRIHTSLNVRATAVELCPTLPDTSIAP